MSHANLRGLVAIVVVAVVVLIAGGGAPASASVEAGSHPHLPALDADTAGVVAQATPGAGDILPGSPVMVIENAGQWPEAARFQVWGGPAGAMWLAEDAIWITVTGRGEAFRTDASPLAANSPGMPRPYVSDQASATGGVNIRITFPGANPHPRLETLERLDTKVSYFLGDDPAQWRSEVPVWGGVRYVDLYPGVDLVVGAAGEARTLWALQAQEGADTSAVKVSVEGVEGAAMAGGLLQMAAAGREVMLPLPGADFRYTVNASTIDGREADQSIASEVGAQAASPTGIPSDLLYSTLLGGSSNDEGLSIAVDASGRAYIAGYSYSSNFPTTPGAFDHSLNGGTEDAFVVRLNAAGSALEYATFLGGSSDDWGNGIAVDAFGRAYVAGGTLSSNFTTTPGAFDRSHNGGADSYAVRLNACGSALEYATYLGGSGNDWGDGIAVDASGRAYVTGETLSSDFPTTPGAVDTSYNGGTCRGIDVDGDPFARACSNAFAVRLGANDSSLDYATFLGGSGGDDAGTAIAVDTSGRAYVTGHTGSDNFSTTPDAFDRSYNGGYRDAFVVRLNASGSALEYATFLGGSGWDWAHGIALDASGRAYVTGETDSSNFPAAPGAFDRSYNGGYRDAFVVRLNASGNALEYATFLGGSGDDWGHGIAVDGAGRAYVTGSSASSNFPTTAAFDASYNGGDAFVVRLNAIGNALEYATFLGGSGDDWGNGIAVIESGRAYVTGDTLSSDFPTTPGAFDRSFNLSDNFVAKLVMGMMDVKAQSFRNNAAPIATYAGCTDTYVAEAANDAYFGNAPFVIASGSHPTGTNKDKWVLLKWNLSSISGWVQTASLTLNVTDPSGAQAYELFEAQAAWSEAYVTWSNRPGRGTTVLGLIAPTKTGVFEVSLNSAGVGVVQKWLESPGTNFGFYLMHTANTDTLRFDSSQTEWTALRPMLTVTYKPPVITKGPWVQDATTSSANVLWETDIYAKGNINYRIKGLTAWTNKAVATTLAGGKWQAKAALTGLTANTTYEYRARASADSAWTAIASFKTAAAVAGPDGASEALPADDTGSGRIFLPLLRR